MKYFWNHEQEVLRNAAKRFAEERIKPLRAELDERDECSVPLMKEMGKLDFMRIFIPKEYDGLDMGVTELCLVQEEFSRVCGGISCAYSVNALGSYPILKWGTEEQKKKYLPKIASAEYLAAFALTEAEAGSDASAIKTTATPCDGGYRLNGTKIFITNGSIADVYVVLATINPKKGIRGITAFIVEKGWDGFRFGEKEKKMGIRATHTCDLLFDEVFVPEENRLGTPGRGFLVAMDNFDHSRTGVGAQALGIAQGAFEEALHYATKRIQFGQPIIAQQAVKFMLADMATQIEAARSLIYNAAATVDSGEKKISKCSAMAKYFASDVAVKVTLDAIQVMGGYGYMKDYPVEKMFRDAKITQIYEGTNQIQRIVVAQELIRELSK